MVLAQYKILVESQFNKLDRASKLLCCLQTSLTGSLHFPIMFTGSINYYYFPICLCKVNVQQILYWETIARQKEPLWKWGICHPQQWHWREHILCCPSWFTVFNGINKFDTIENILVARWLGGAWLLSLLCVASILSTPDHGWIPSFPSSSISCWCWWFLLAPLVGILLPPLSPCLPLTLIAFPWGLMISATLICISGSCPWMLEKFLPECTPATSAPTISSPLCPPCVFSSPQSPCLL